MHRNSHQNGFSAVSSLFSNNFLALCIFFFSGLTALIYEVLWLKELGLLFGNSSYAMATTLAAFFLGLGVGGEYWGKRAACHNSSLRLYGFLELGVAFCALGYFLLLNLYSSIYSPLFAEFGSHRTLFTAAKFCLALLILFPPAFFMGGTLPVISQYVVKNNGELGGKVSLLYAVNTLGAVFGACLAGFYLPKTLGFTQSYWLAIAFTVAIAGIALTFSKITPNPIIPAKNSPTKPVATHLQIIAFISGLLTLGLQVLWNRMFAQVLQNSVYTFALILMVFLFCLALGSLLAHWLMRCRLNNQLILFFMLFTGACLVMASPFTFMYWTDNLHYLGANKAWLDYLFEIAWVALVIIGTPLLFLGTVFPLLIKLGEGQGANYGVLVGRLAAVNTSGAIVGSLLTGFFVLDQIGLWPGIRLMAVLYLLTAWYSLSQSRFHQSFWTSLPAIGILLAVSVLDTGKLPVVEIDPVNEDESLIELWEGSAGTVAVIRKGEHLKIKLNNHYTLGGTGSSQLEKLEAILPLAAHPHPRSVYQLGLGTGITAGGALTFPIKKLVVAEIISDVIIASEKYFANFLNGLFYDPRVHIVEEDGRNYLRGTNGHFDVIISDLFIPWKAGVGSLYSLEHYQTIRQKLNDQGLFMQWLPSYQMTEAEFNVIINTMLQVFPQLTVWRGDFSALKPIIGLMGHKTSQALPVTAKIVLQTQEQPPLLSYYVGSLESLRRHYSQFQLNTDDKPLIEYDAPISQRQVKAEQKQWLSGDDLMVFLQQVMVQKDSYLAALDNQQKRIPKAGLHLHYSQLLKYQGKLKQSKREMELYQQIMNSDQD
jgi:spermidine synthase